MVTEVCKATGIIISPSPRATPSPFQATYGGLFMTTAGKVLDNFKCDLVQISESRATNLEEKKDEGNLVQQFFLSYIFSFFAIPFRLSKQDDGRYTLHQTHRNLHDTSLGREHSHRYLLVTL
jgi:hypothetical protein